MGQFKQKWSCVLLLFCNLCIICGGLSGVREVCVFIETSSLAMRHQLCFSYSFSLLYYFSTVGLKGVGFFNIFHYFVGMSIYKHYCRVYIIII